MYQIIADWKKIYKIHIPILDFKSTFTGDELRVEIKTNTFKPNHAFITLFILLW